MARASTGSRGTGSRGTGFQGAGAFDLGPAWIWPGQPRIAALVERFGLGVFDQHVRGDLVYETERGEVQRGRGVASMQGALRLRGGLGALIPPLAATLPEGAVLCGTAIAEIETTQGGILARTAGGQTIAARRVVLALPPRVIARSIRFSAPLPPAATEAMRRIPTWMAGQAKAVAVYATPFWREAGLSGDAMSRIGPLVEIHDASPADHGPFALFGFVGIPAEARRDREALRHRVTAQLVRLFGVQAGDPLALFVKDWADDALTATPEDLAPLYSHPGYGQPAALATLARRGVFFAGTEMAAGFGGFIEGALEAAEQVRAQLGPERAGRGLSTQPPEPVISAGWGAGPGGPGQ